MPFNLGLCCFARPTQAPSRSKFGRWKLPKNMFRTSVAFIKNVLVLGLQSLLLMQ